MKSLRLMLLVTALVGVLFSGTAQAADPPSGTLSKSRKSVSWAGSFVLSQPDSVGGCVGGAEDPICDHFLLKISLGDGTRIRIDLPAPDALSDLDLFVYSPSGSEVGRSANAFGTNEFVEFRHSGRFRNKVYEVRVKPWLVVPGITYKATAKVR